MAWLSSRKSEHGFVLRRVLAQKRLVFETRHYDPFADNPFLSEMERDTIVAFLGDSDACC
jgi:hypothetical protein